MRRDGAAAAAVIKHIQPAVALRATEEPRGRRRNRWRWSHSSSTETPLAAPGSAAFTLWHQHQSDTEPVEYEHVAMYKQSTPAWYRY